MTFYNINVKEELNEAAGVIHNKPEKYSCSRSCLLPLFWRASLYMHHVAG